MSLSEFETKGFLPPKMDNISLKAFKDNACRFTSIKNAHFVQWMRYLRSALNALPF